MQTQAPNREHDRRTKKERWITDLGLEATGAENTEEAINLVDAV